MSEFAREISWPGLDAVVEAERHPRQVLVDDVAQVELHRVRGAQQKQARDVGRDPGRDRQHEHELT